MTTIQIKGTKYHSHPVLSCGDYSDTGMVGISNIEVILENHAENVLDVWNELSQEEEDFDPEEIEVILVRGNYSSRTVFVREDLFDAYEKQLDNYPLLNEDDHSNREHEKAVEDWQDYGAKEFVTELKKKAIALYEDPDLELYLETYEPSNDELWNLYNENSNYGSVYEGCSTFFYLEEAIKEIASMDFFRDLLIQAKQYAKARQKQASELEAILFE